MLRKLTAPRHASSLIRILWISAALCALTTSVSLAGDWLTKPEKDFFDALGFEVRINTTTHRQSFNPERLKIIANGSPADFGGLARGFVSSLESMQARQEDQIALQKALRAGGKEMQKQAFSSFIDVLLGKTDAWDVALDVTNAALSEDRLTEIYSLRTNILKRINDATADRDAIMEQITDRLASRSGKTRPSSDLNMRLSVQGQQLFVEGTANARLSDPIIQVSLMRPEIGEKLAREYYRGFFLSEIMGLRPGSPDEIHKHLESLVREENRNYASPVTVTQYSPTIDTGQKVRATLGLNLRSILGVNQVRLRVWTSEGKLEAPELAGLNDATSKARSVFHLGRQPIAVSPPLRADTSRSSAVPRGTSPPTNTISGFKKAPPKTYINLQPQKPAKNTLEYNRCTPSGESSFIVGDPVKVPISTNERLLVSAMSNTHYVIVWTHPDTRAKYFLLIPASESAQGPSPE